MALGDALDIGVGTSGQVVQSNGTTITLSTATYPLTMTANQILFSSATNTVTGIATANGGVLVTSNAGVPSVLVGSGTTNTILQATAAGTPAWSTATYPATTTINQLLFSSSANVIGGITTGNNGVLITSAGGVPSISSTIPTATQSNITTVGTIGTGVWQGTIVGGTYGGTGVNNGASTITIGGNVTFSGAFTTAITVTAGTTVTLPTTGTLVNTAVTTLSSLVSIGTISTGTWQGTVVGATYGGTGVNNGANTLTLAGNLTTTGAFNPTLAFAASNTYTFPSASQTMLGLAGGTLTGQLNFGGLEALNAATPTLATSLATKGYVDQNALSNTAVHASTTAALTVTQAGAGVGATLTNAGAQATFALDGVNPPVGVDVLVKNQAAASQNGIYILTNVGSGATNWILSRADSYDTPGQINDTGSIVVQNGTTLAGTSWYNTSNVATVDTTAINYLQSGAPLPLSFANGGTGAALTASNGGILWSNATTAAILSGTATAGLALLSGSSAAPTWSTKPPVTQVVIQTFAAGTSTYTPTVGMKFCTVEIVAGGGSGGAVTGGTAGQCSAASGGTAGGYCRKTYTSVLIGANATVVVGSGGALAAAGANNGNAGGNSTFTPAGAGAVLTAGGGPGGNAMSKSAAAQSASPGGASTATGGDINIVGERGGYGATQAAAALASPGTGGGSFLSPASLPTIFTIAGNGATAATGYGGGSSGAFDITIANTASIAGNDGVCYITEYISV